MPTCLLTQDVLNAEVSCFANYDTPVNPQTIKLHTWLKSLKYRAKVDQIRAMTVKVERDAAKARLPAITPSGVFTYRKANCLLPGKHSGLIQFDIDMKDNPRIRNYADLKVQIGKLPFVAYCGLSCSGTGYWGLVPIAYHERHSQHFDALKRVFAHYGITLDNKPRNVASLRGYSYDELAYLPEQVIIFELYDVQAPSNFGTFQFTTDADKERTRVEVCINEVLRRGLYLGSNYEEWFAIGCALANTFGESGRDYFVRISENYPRHSKEPNKQYTACLRTNSKATLGTFFFFCLQAGIEWRDLIQLSENKSYKRVEKTPLVVNTFADWFANPNSILRPNESDIERLTVEPCDDYPAEWN